MDSHVVVSRRGCHLLASKRSGIDSMFMTYRLCAGSCPALSWASARNCKSDTSTFMWRNRDHRSSCHSWSYKKLDNSEEKLKRVRTSQAGHTATVTSRLFFRYPNFLVIGRMAII